MWMLPLYVTGISNYGCQQFTLTHLITDAHQFPAKINIKMHFLVSVGPRAIPTAKRLERDHCITAEVPTAYLIVPPK
jgi:hypothetical protein